MFHGPVFIPSEASLTKLIRSRVIPFLCALTLLSTMRQLALRCRRGCPGEALAAARGTGSRTGALDEIVECAGSSAYYMGYTITESQRADSVPNGRCSQQRARNGGCGGFGRTESTSWTIPQGRRAGRKRAAGSRPYPLTMMQSVAPAIWLETTSSTGPLPKADQNQDGQGIKVERRRTRTGFFRERLTLPRTQAPSPWTRKQGREKVRAVYKSLSRIAGLSIPS